MTPLLEIHDVTAGYGRIAVVNGLTVTVDEDEGVALLGPNGHGKTTLLRAVSGLQRTSAGEVRFAGRPITDASPREILDLGLVHVPQGNRLFPECTVQENLDLGAFGRRRWRERRRSCAEVFELFPILAERSGQACRTLSGGERQMLAIGIGLMAGPRLLILDEPTLGLAPRVKDDLSDAIAKIRAGGVSVLLVDGDVELVYSLVDRWYFVERGRVVMQGGVDERLAKDEMVARYFGAAT
jgi:branched-chain amino acid transport system ATP-binding protein